MLPWIFAVLILVNVGLFVWGYQRERSLEPPPTPVPRGSYEIRLLGEVPEQGAAEAPSAEPNAGGGDSAVQDVVGPTEEDGDEPAETAEDAPVRATSLETGVGGRKGPGQPVTGSSESVRSGLSSDELKAKAPAAPVDSTDDPPPRPPSSRGDGAMSDEPVEGAR
jgi:hypothetical protein